MDPFTFAIPFGLIGPAFATGVFAHLWRAKLQHFWWFIGVGGIASYVLMAMCLAWALSDVGITGSLSGAPKPVLVKTRLVIHAFSEQFRALFAPFLERLNGRFMVESALRNVVIVDLDVVAQRRFEFGA